MKAYDVTSHDGHTVDWLTKAALLECERRLGYKLTIAQGSYHKGVSASAGTHDGGGVVDLSPWDWRRKVRVLRRVGFAAWHRPAIKGLWPEHIHAVLIGNDKLAPVAARQVIAYRNRRDGLASNRRDLFPWHPNGVMFRWPGQPALDAILHPVPLPPKPKPPVKVTARITTANIASTLPVDAIKADYAAALAGTDILCTQENQIRRANQFVPAGWGTFQGAGGVQGRCAIHWRESVWALASARLLELNAANGLTFPGAHRVGAVVVLSHRATGKQIKVTNAHLVPHADEDTKPGVLTSFPRGVKAVIPAIDSLVADAAKNPAPVQVICGDVNVDLDSDLAIKDTGMVERFAAAGFVTDVAQLGATPDTHGASEYDWLMAKGAKWVAHETRPKGKSDHRAKTATVEF